MWQVIHGDCLEVLPTLGKVDAVVTDPPYGIGEAAGKNESRGKLADVRAYGNDDWDDEPISSDLLAAVIASAPVAVIFGGNYYVLPPSPCWLVWDKDNTGDFADCELAWTNLKKAVRRLKWRWNGMLQENGGRFKEIRYHPTQKPVPVMRWCITHLGLPPGSTILDPFCGSGSTGMACKREGRSFLGVERNPEYCEVARSRLRGESEQTELITESHHDTDTEDDA